MKRLILLVMVMLTACAPSAQAIQTAIAQTQAAEMSAEQKDRFNKVLEDGAMLSSMSEQGVTYSDFNQQLAKVKSNYDLATTAPSAKGISSETKAALDQAFNGWELALHVWDDKNYQIQNAIGAPYAWEDDEKRIAEIEAYVGQGGLSRTSAQSIQVDHSNGALKKIKFDAGIGLVLAVASEHWKNAQRQLVAEMQ